SVTDPTPADPEHHQRPDPRADRVVVPLDIRTRRWARRGRNSLGCDDCRKDEGDKRDRKSTRLNSSHGSISYAVFCLKKKNTQFFAFLFAAISKRLRQRKWTTAHAHLYPHYTRAFPHVKG